MIDFATLTQQSVATLATGGQYFVIRCTPDPFTGETLNVGVCVIEPNGKRHVKVITEPGRLECLYGDSGASMVVSMASIAGAYAQQGLHSPSTQICFDTPLPYFNASPEETLEAAFAEQVTVALPRKNVKATKTVDDDQALTLISDLIKRKLSLKADAVLAQNPQLIINTDQGPRAIKVPLLPNNGAGAIRSADYSAPSLKTHLMDSLLDVECAGRYAKKKYLGMFILRPAHHTPQHAAAIDNVIDSIAFRAPHNLRLEVSEDGDVLAEHICDWAEAAA